jgi:nucleoid DNA-binding protein
MTTIELINKIAVSHNITTGRAEMIISILIERLIDMIKKDKQVVINNFGVFKVVTNKPESPQFTDLSKPIPMNSNQLIFEPDRNFLEKLNSV